MAVRGVKPKKAVPTQAFLKILLYGETGCGKTILMLALLKWFASLSKGKRAFVFDTEHSTDFYTVPVPERLFHPEAFDFDLPTDATRDPVTLLEFLKNLTGDDPYCAVGVDSMTHFWEACPDLYTGKRKRDGGLPVGAWNTIKKTWRQIQEAAIFGPYHFVETAREGTQFVDTETDDWVNKGPKPRSEKDTKYEPSMTIRLYQDKDWNRRAQTAKFSIIGYVEKDRSGIWTGKEIDFTAERPGELITKIDSVFRPVLSKLAPVIDHANPKTMEETTEEGVQKLAAARQEQEDESFHLYEAIRQAISSAKTMDELRAAWSLTDKKITKLGDDRYEALTALKDAQKGALIEAAKVAVEV